MGHTTTGEIALIGTAAERLNTVSAINHARLKARSCSEIELAGIMNALGELLTAQTFYLLVDPSREASIETNWPNKAICHSNIVAIPLRDIFAPLDQPIHILPGCYQSTA